jgi:antitoxin HigA-1
MIHDPLHPGKMVCETLIEGASLSVSDAAKKLGVSRATLSRLFNGRCGLSPEMALRLSKLLPNTDVKFWLNLQQDYDIWNIKQKSNKIKVKPLKVA